jgi:hypothetical protein
VTRHIPPESLIDVPIKKTRRDPHGALILSAAPSARYLRDRMQGHAEIASAAPRTSAALQGSSFVARLIARILISLNRRTDFHSATSSNLTRP